MRNLSAAALLMILVSRPASAGTVSGSVALVKDASPVSDASGAVVWIEGARQTGAGSPRAAMKQSSKRFLPRVLVVPKEATVEFPNDDPIYHNVFSVSAANRFDLGLYRSGATKSKKFEQPGLVRVYCNIHPQMIGFVMVVDSDFAAVTARDGSFRFENVPPGAYVLKAWHEQGGEASVPIAVGPGGESPLAIRIDVSGFRPEPHKNKYGKDYPPQAAPPSDDRY